MRLTWLIFVIFYVSSIANAARRRSSGSSGSSGDASSAGDKGQARVDELVRLKAKYGGAVLPLSDRNFTRFVTDKPRHYHAAMFLTAKDSRYGCAPCNAAQKAFEDMATQYQNQYELDAVDASHRIVFFVIDVDSAREVFNSLKMETVPRLFIMPPKLTDDAPNHKASQYEVNTAAMLGGMSGLLEELNRVSGVPVRQTVDPLPTLLVLSTVSALLAVVANAAQGDLGKVYSLACSPRLWIFFSLAAFAFGVSGSVYCIIRNTPAYDVGRDGRFRLFSEQSRDQTVLEGLTVALFTFGFALSLFFVNAVATSSRWHVPVVRRFLPNSVNGSIDRVLRAIAVSAALALLLVSFDALWESYIYKTQWYRITDTMPKWIWKPFADKVVRSSGLAKRLLKLASVYIYDFKNWPAFYKSCDVYLFKFLNRSVFGSS